MTGRRVIAVDYVQSVTLYVDAPADIDVAEVCDWVEDGDDAPRSDASYSGHVLDVGHVRNVLSCGYPIVVMDDHRRADVVVTSWDDLQAARRRLDPPDPKAPTVGQRDIFGGRLESFTTVTKDEAGRLIEWMEENW